MMQLLSIAVGGAIGALCRYWVVLTIDKFIVKPFPYGTLAVNILGSFLLGIIYVLIIEKLSLSHQWQSTLMVGFLGAFTTFSTFALETVLLIESNHIVMAVTYTLLSVILCILAVLLAVWIARTLC